MGAVNQWKWVNQFQPQTLYMATILCYVDAVFGLLFGFVATSLLAGLITIAALAAGGFGIANEKKWGYAVAVGGARVARCSWHAVRGVICFCFAALWGFAAIASGLWGFLPGLIGIGAMAACMFWLGRRAFAKAHGALG